MKCFFSNFFPQGPRQQSSGGSHAGYGGQRTVSTPYDYVKEPTLPGEGGGPPHYLSSSSALGGGVIRMVVRDLLHNDGEISARFVTTLLPHVFTLPNTLVSSFYTFIF